MDFPIPQDLIDLYQAVQVDHSDTMLAAYGAALQAFRGEHPYLELRAVMAMLARAASRPAA